MTRGSGRTAAIVLNWNGVAGTRRAIASLLAAESAPALVVVDNGSTDRDEIRQIERVYPQAETIALEANVGFARAVNAGARHAIGSGAEFILLFNNDAWLEPGSGAIARLQEALDRDAGLAAVGPRIVNADGTSQSVGYRYSLWFPVPRPCRSAARPPRYLSGSCLLIRASAFVALGGLDPDYFFYGDDVDFALRLERVGLRVALLAGERAFHERAQSIRLHSPNYAYTALRSNLIVVRKHCRAAQRPSALVTLVAISVALAFLGLRAGYRDTPLAVWRAWSDFRHGRWGGFGGERLEPVERPGIADLQCAV